MLNNNGNNANNNNGKLITITFAKSPDLETDTRIEAVFSFKTNIGVVFRL